MEVYRSVDGSEVAVVAATWELNPRISFESLAPEFQKNPTKAWRNYGSRVSGVGGQTALKDPGIMLRRINFSRRDPWDYARDQFYPDFRGRRDREYYIHIDLAQNKDAAGIACAHREPTGVAVVDFMHAHRARPGQDIQFAEIREKYIYALHARGFHIRLVTLDQWQSIEFRQVLSGQGWLTDEQSADKTTAPYDTLIEMLGTDRIDYYNEPQFIREMQALQTNGTKYDHPKKGSKDVADAVACAVYRAIFTELEDPTAPKAILRVNRAPVRSPLRRQYERSNW